MAISRARRHAVLIADFDSLRKALPDQAALRDVMDTFELLGTSIPIRPLFAAVPASQPAVVP